MNFIGNDRKSKTATACQNSPGKVSKVIMKWSVAANKQSGMAAAVMAGFITTIWHFHIHYAPFNMVCQDKCNSSLK